MTTQLHTILSLSFLSTVNLLMYFRPSQLIGFLHGPLAQIDAADRWQFTETFLRNDGRALMDPTACDAYNEAYEGSGVYRDAGVIAALFAWILVLTPRFLPMEYSTGQRRGFLILIPLVWITPGFAGQILSKNIPVEISFLTSQGLNGFITVGLCSIKGLMVGANQSTFIVRLLYDLKVVGLAGGLLFLLLGILPIEQKLEK